jgi:hypothetical protein
MAIVVVGGQARHVGKTSVVTGLIAALPEWRWTAIKISQHPHALPERDQERGAGGQEPSYAFTEEFDRSGQSDTSRYLAAGARRALWLRSLPGRLEDAMPCLHHELDGAANVLIESNSVLQFLHPDLYLIVLDPANADFKPSARKHLDAANAVILAPSAPGTPERELLWDGVSLAALASKPILYVCPPVYVTEELIGFVRKAVASSW